jgi:hypothetical protein
LNFEKARRLERQNEIAAAKKFLQLTRQGDGDALLAISENVMPGDAWRLALRRISGLTSVTPEVSRAFEIIWRSQKTIALRVGHRPTVAKALRVLLPQSHDPIDPVRLYRGTNRSEFFHRIFGFSWTTDLEIAKNFATSNKLLGQGVVLETMAPPGSIFRVFDNDGFFDENEVLVDPFKLAKVRIIPPSKNDNQQSGVDK